MTNILGAMQKPSVVEIPDDAVKKDNGNELGEAIDWILEKRLVRSLACGVYLGSRSEMASQWSKKVLIDCLRSWLLDVSAMFAHDSIGDVSPDPPGITTLSRLVGVKLKSLAGCWSKSWHLSHFQLSCSSQVPRCV